MQLWASCCCRLQPSVSGVEGQRREETNWGNLLAISVFALIMKQTMGEYPVCHNSLLLGVFESTRPRLQCDVAWHDLSTVASMSG